MGKTLILISAATLLFLNEAASRLEEIFKHDCIVIAREEVIRCTDKNGSTFYYRVEVQDYDTASYRISFIPFYEGKTETKNTEMETSPSGD